MRSFVGALLASLISATSVLALDPPTGPVVLTVKGEISNTNAGDTAQFDRAMLDGLKHRKAEMETPWTEGKVTFEGPLLREILTAVGATGTILKVRALNDYAADVPADDARLQAILATKLDGKPMSVRDKGPLMLVYPFDLDADLYNEKYFSRSVWQIKEIEVGR
ncbi:molybdopterin-dependent oxidoreductase [Rhizobium sp. 'Codium 1']|uniref:molybdopterin-dependent oxidoreductase n=1 Tax=Rhizobium sp. 'Codium 1' TaxID=2940484 RepID=UPI001E4D2CED|nr:molybdopterin-dependent oxidoreductase [Rhizobium sp. 'Codium 1']MCC8931605.1 molybdopterin-dependent oxidoreductase [Rhizobium sp. 'Codium 1']